MKVHYPVEFMAATLTASSGKSEDVVKYVNACREMKIPVLPPDVNSLAALLLARRRSDPLRARRREGRRRGRGEFDPRRARGGRAVRLAHRLLLPRQREAEQPEGHRGADPVRLVRLPREDARRPRRRRRLRHGRRDRREEGRTTRAREGSSPTNPPTTTGTVSRTCPSGRPTNGSATRRRRSASTSRAILSPASRRRSRLFGDVTAERVAEKVDQNVKIVALLASLKKTQIKKGQNEGKMMAKGVLEDLTGSVPVTIFASLLERVGPWLAEGRPVLVSGVVRSSSAPGAPEPDGEGGNVPVEIIAREIQALEGMREAAACEVRLVTPVPGTLDETFASVREILESSPGSVPVSLEVRRPGHWEVTVRTAGRLAVRPTPELTRGLERLLGPRSVRYVYAHS